MNASPLVVRPCPLCGSSDDSQVAARARFDADRLDEFAFSSRKPPEYMHHRLIACPVCDLVYASPVPATPQSLAKAYEDAAFDSDVESRYASFTYGRLLARLEATLPDLIGAIDVGTGDGAFLEQLLAHGFTDVVGVEPSSAPIRAAKAPIRPLIRSGPFEFQQGDEGRFSLVTCFQTLEHLYDPAALPARIRHPEGQRRHPDRLSQSACGVGKAPRHEIADLRHRTPADCFRQGVSGSYWSERDFPPFESYRLEHLSPPLLVEAVSASGGPEASHPTAVQDHRNRVPPVSILAGNIAAIGYKHEREASLVKAWSIDWLHQVRSPLARSGLA